MNLSRGGPDDAAAVIALFDEAVAFFVRDGTFDVKGWKGQVFSMRLGSQPGTSLR